MFIATIYLARSFGPTDFGIINFSSAIVTYFSGVASLGLQTLGIVEIKKNMNNRDNTTNIILSLRIVLSILTYIMLILFVIFLNRDNMTKIMILISGLTILASSFYIDWVFYALEKMEYVSYSMIIKNLLYSLIVVIVIVSKIYNKIYIVPISMSIGTLISSIYLYYEYKIKIKARFDFTFSLNKYKELLNKSWPFFFSGVFATLNSNADTIIIGFTRTSTDVGLYNSVYKIITVLITFASYIYTPVYPLLIEYYNKKNFDKLNDIVNKIRKLVFIAIFPVFSGAFIVNKEVMLTLYGTDYASAYPVFTILTIYVALLFIREIYGYELSAWNLQKKYMKVVLISSLYNVVSNLIFIPRYGIIFAAFNTLFSEIINLTLMYKISRKCFKAKYDNSYISKIVLCVIIMTVSVLFIKNYTMNAFLLTFSGAIIYIIALTLFRVISITLIKKVITKEF